MDPEDIIVQQFETKFNLNNENKRFAEDLLKFETPVNCMGFCYFLVI